MDIITEWPVVLMWYTVYPEGVLHRHRQKGYFSFMVSLSVVYRTWFKMSENVWLSLIAFSISQCRLLVYRCLFKCAGSFIFFDIKLCVYRIVMKAKVDHSTFLDIFFHAVMTVCTMFSIFRSFSGSIYSLPSLAGDKHLAYSIRVEGKKMVLMDAAQKAPKDCLSSLWGIKLRIV